MSKNRKGYQNLSKLSSIGLIDGAYYVPRIDKQLLEQYKEGLIATTGGLNSEIPYLILNVGCLLSQLKVMPYTHVIDMY